MSCTGPSHRVGAAYERKTDRDTFPKIFKIVNEVSVDKSNPHRVLQVVRVVLNNRETVKSILQRSISPHISSAVVSTLM